jgi:histidinol-phosphate aminotransferase
MAPTFVRPTVRQMAGYSPGEQPGVGERIIKLNTNENPFPPSPRVMQALADIEAEQLRRYPSPTADLFRRAAARALGVSMDMIIAGNGSDDTLSVAVRTFCSPGDILACPEPTYSLYPVLAEISEVNYAPIPWEAGYELPIEGLLSLRPRAIFFANPNAPTGTMVRPARVKELLERFDGLVLVDEAYADFADEDCIALVKDHPNLVISRTFSKAYSMAGVRFGFGIAQEQVIAQMMKVKDSYNCDAISICLATAAIEDQEYARETWDRIRSERRRLADELESLGWGVLPSHANFLLATAPDGDGRSAYLGLKHQGILVRFFDKPGLRDKVRITVGTSQENNALLAGVRALSNRHGGHADGRREAV